MQTPAPSPSPAPEGAETSFRRARVGLALSLLASWLLMLSPLPYSLATGATAVVAGYFLVRVVIGSWRRGRRGTVVVAALFGVPAVALMVLSTVISALFYGPMIELQECRSQAITSQARAACDQQSQESVAQWIGGLLGG
ncbi:hypothetical protein [Brachybacterium hainanense]|uniref:AI-2E family transporter n=1 Tax=Brachybacterium hainanense TaxID=1541174 RepID=A0ABV6RFP5_9MICO